MRIRLNGKDTAPQTDIRGPKYVFIDEQGKIHATKDKAPAPVSK